MLITLGTLVAMDYLEGIGFARTWPILLIVFGMLKLLEKLRLALPIKPPVRLHAARRQRDMRRGSIIGPLILIGIGVLFLVRNIWPDIPVLEILSRYWPFLLIAWGGLRLIEILLWACPTKPIPRNGISGGEWVLIVLHMRYRRDDAYRPPVCRPVSDHASAGTVW